MLSTAAKPRNPGAAGPRSAPGKGSETVGFRAVHAFQLAAVPVPVPAALPARVLRAPDTLPEHGPADRQPVLLRLGRGGHGRPDGALVPGQLGPRGLGRPRAQPREG